MSIMIEKSFVNIFEELKEKALNRFRVTGVCPTQSIAITRNLIQVPFDMQRGLIPAGVLGVAYQGYVLASNAIKEGLVIGVFIAQMGKISKYHLFNMEPDYLHLDRKNFLWFEFNSRILTLREAYYINYSATPPELTLIPRTTFDKVVENEVEDLFRLDS